MPKKPILNAYQARNINPADIFKLENWAELLNARQPYSGNNPDTQDPRVILKKLDKLNSQGNTELIKDYLGKIEPFWRGIFAPIFYRSFENASQDQNNKNTFVVHFPGTQIAQDNLFDPMTAALYYNDVNYRHVNGVTNLILGVGGGANASTVAKEINAWTQAKINSGTNIENLTVVCSSFSRGSAVIEMITELHKLQPKLKIHVCLIDPVRGWIDGPRAATESKELPSSVKTGLIIYANPKIIDPAFMAVTFQRELRPQSKDTLFMAISQNAGHNAVGLFNEKQPHKNKQVYVTYWLYFKFLVHAGVLDKNTFMPDLNDAYVQKWTQPLHQQYMSDKQLRILENNLNKMDNDDEFKTVIERSRRWANLPLPTDKSTVKAKL